MSQMPSSIFLSWSQRRLLRFFSLWSVLILCFLLAPAARTGVIVDLNHNGMSDIWEWLHGAYGIDPNADPDGDGMSNLQESIAGTNPFDASSVFRIQAVSITGTNVSVTIASALGKFYQLQSTALLGSGAAPAWLTETGLVARTGTNVTLSASAGPATKFFRMTVSDVDTDGDGVNDWEEYQLGLDPFNPTSNGQLDANGLPMTDYAYVAGKLTSQNVLSILATGPAATQPDPGQDVSAPGMFTLARGGFPLNDITVQLGVGGPGAGFATAGVDAFPLPPAVEFPTGVSVQQIPVTPLSNTNLLAPVLAMLRVLPGAGYSLGASSNASVVIYPSPTGNGAGLTGQYFNSSSAIYANGLNFDPANLVVTRIDPGINFVWGPATVPNLSNSLWSVRWTGQVQPQYSETYYFDAYTDDGLKLWVNDHLIIDNWIRKGASDTVGSISLQGGVRYDIKMEYYQAGGSAVAQLYWYSPSQPKQSIPGSRLYPAASTSAPGAITSPMSAVGFLGQPFTFTVIGADSPAAFTSSGLPTGLSLNPRTGVISGTPGTAGTYQIILASSNSAGVGASVLSLQLFNSAAVVTREIWTGAPGVNITDIPVNTVASLTNSLPGLQGIADYGDNYAERVRGFLTAPATGNYYFWITGSDSAELWISNDADPVNKTRRSYVLPTPDSAAPPANGAGPGQWSLQPNQKSGWLSLVAGQSYYVEILHKAGTGSGDNWAVAWLQDPVGTGAAPGGPVPGYLLSPYQPPPLSRIAGTLYSANLLPDGAPGSSGSGTASLLLSADETTATVRFAYSGLSSSATAKLIYSEPYLNNPSTLIFDIDASSPQADGSYFWPITPVGTLAAADVVEIIKEGKAYLGINTTLHPSEPGEIDGNFIPITGSQTFALPPPSPAWADDSSDANAAARFLIQATFGPSLAGIANVRSVGYSNWINNQLALPATHHLPVVLANKSGDPVTPFPSSLTFEAWWRQSVTAPDQLRQRMAFALSEIMVVSENGVLENNATALSSDYDTLLDHAFGNYRSLLEAVTLTPAMGLYLDMRGNDAGSIITGVHADENYAREVQQLFSIGLNRLWPDGSLVLNSQGALVPTYDQNVVMGFASVFTGWNYYQANQANGRLPSNWYPSSNYTNSMVLVPAHHELGSKQLLDNVFLPPASGGEASPSSPAFDQYGSQDLESALDSLFNHQNAGPFLCRELIQRLVTSNPSRGYIYRVAQVFDNNGAGVRGDLSAVVKAILLDYEARSPAMITQPAYGKQREPLLRVTAPARAFPAPLPFNGSYSQNGTQTISVATTNSHRLNNGDSVLLAFTDASGRPPPESRSYSVTVTGPSTFTVNDPGLAAGSYAQTNTTITVAVSGHGLLPGNSAYLDFTTGGAASGVYLVTAANSSASFNVNAPNSASLRGNCLLSKLPGAGYVQSGGTITITINGPHGLSVGDSVCLVFTSGTAASGVYRVATIPDPSHFTVGSTISANQTQSSLEVYPLAPPPMVRSGSVSVQESLWTMGYTDGGNSSSLAQTPLRSPTVFNFFYPNYEFPGALAAAGLTTPEFQLTSDTTVALQMNFLAGGILNNSGNTNGLSSFASGNGSVVLDIGPWMTPQYASSAGLPTLVEALNTLLVAGQLSAGAQAAIAAYAGNQVNFPYGLPATASQMRDRVRAVVHLILTSPDFTIQK
jgi:hypothetical protein